MRAELVLENRQAKGCEKFIAKTGRSAGYILLKRAGVPIPRC